MAGDARVIRKLWPINLMPVEAMAILYWLTASPSAAHLALKVMIDPEPGRYLPRIFSAP